MFEATKETIFNIFKELPGVPALIEADNEQKKKRAHLLLAERAALVKAQLKAVGEAAARTRKANARLVAARAEYKAAMLAHARAISGEFGISHHHGRKIAKVGLELQAIAEPLVKELRRSVEKREAELRTGEPSYDKRLELDRIWEIRGLLNSAHLQPDLEKTVSKIQIELARSA